MKTAATIETFNARRAFATFNQGTFGTMTKPFGTIARAEQRLRDAKRRVAEIEEQIRPFQSEGWPIPGGIRRDLVAAKAELRAAELAERYGHKPGTPETYAALDAVPSNRRQSPIGRLYESGAIDDDQHNAAEEIATVAEMIERAVSVRGASLEARVDNSGAGKDKLVEHLVRVRLEVTYSAWRLRLPMPRRMVLDMLLTNQPLTATARAYKVPWRKARKVLIDAIDRWIDIKERVWSSVEPDDVESVYRKLGGGTLLGGSVDRKR